MELFCKLEEVVYVDIVRVESFLVIFMQIPIKLLYLELYVELSTHYFLSQNFSHFYFIRISYSFVSMWKQPKDNWILYNRRPDRSHHVYKHEKNTHILTCDVVCYCFFLIMHKLKHIKPKQCYFRLSQYANTTDPLNGGSWGAGYSGGCSPILFAWFIDFVQYLEHLLAWNPPHLFFFLIRPDFYYVLGPPIVPTLTLHDVCILYIIFSSRLHVSFNFCIFLYTVVVPEGKCRELASPFYRKICHFHV